jgi:hypothetical protein
MRLSIHHNYGRENFSKKVKLMEELRSEGVECLLRYHSTVEENKLFFVYDFAFDARRVENCALSGVALTFRKQISSPLGPLLSRSLIFNLSAKMINRNVSKS